MDNERISLYFKLIEAVMDVMNLGKQLKPNSNQAKKLGRKVQEIGLKMMAVSTDEVIQSYLKWRAVSSLGEDPEQTIHFFCELIISMRKEMLPNTTRTFNDVLDCLT